ncbi:uncharacterized protein [Trachinotus anak]|uniref:uncharacterized protein isoform X2 n=1 Tax=Trachinotus anak TaxID=443729 RepID=UPI0039F1D69E
MFLILLLFVDISTVAALPGVNNETDPIPDCTHNLDQDMMFCHFEAQNCHEYNLTLQSNDGYGMKGCIPEQCDRGQCCCSIQVMIVWGESHTATVWKGGQRMASNVISINKSLKPITPTIVSVKEANGNFEVKWKTNMVNRLVEMLTSCVIYHKKGNTEKVCQFVQPSNLDGLKVYEIVGRDLEQSTTYVVSVKSYSNESGKYSDSSNEVEFKTPSSPSLVVLVLIVSLSIAAVLISGGLYVCYVKLKTQWWDKIGKGPNPKLLIMRPYDKTLLKPDLTIVSSACVEPLTPDDSKPWSKGSLTDTSCGSFQQSSGISTGSSCLSYANTAPADIIAGVHDALGKAFPNISPISPLTPNLFTEPKKDSGLFSAPDNPCGVRADDVNSGSSGFDNKTYSILIPNCPQQIMINSSEVQTQAAMVCDSAYHPSEGDMVTCPDQQVQASPLFNLPQVVSSLIPSDMSYQPCNADSGRLSYAEDSSLSSISSGTNTTASCDPVSGVEPVCESFDDWVSDSTKPNGKSEETTVCDDNPCYGCLPTGSRSFPQVNDDYQAFQSLVGQPDVLISEERSGEREEHLSKYSAESFTKIPPVTPGFINNFQGGQCVSELQKPFLSLISADQPMTVITDSGYQSV